MAGPEVVFALYRPKPGQDAALREQIALHMPSLRKYELVTDRESILVRAKDGTYIEIFEWADGDSSRQAHEHPAIAKIWEAMGACADLISISELAESRHPFSHFQPVAL